jgi:anti-sigma-K factor RskA
MNVNDSALRDRLAAEYVLGTLQGAARRRFERWLDRDAALRGQVAEWEERMSPLGSALPPVEPPADAWRMIEQRIASQRKRVNLWYCVEFWRAVGIVASLAVIALLVYLALAPRQPVVAYVAVLTDTAAQPELIISASPARDALRVHAVAARPAPPGKSLQLWLVPDSQHAPLSLGLVPGEGSRTLEVPVALRQALGATATLAVSIEPAGGSPTGQLTGPVIYQGKWLKRD